MDITNIDFKKMNDIIPTIIQDSKTNEVFMLGYMNKVSLQNTIKTGDIHFWSRSRNMLWKKGETSGNQLKVKEIYLDCDGDTLLIKVQLIGINVCHTGKRTCFTKQLSFTQK
ncbi:MAG: phosphoribosyl-AMP cyclohydrolase [Candidatus Roizmanbacteria bacterium]|nr:phosphoribosyl-AMP cyclohydrolase [Candidatus Roizmanbacteria bacterium]